MNVQHNLIAINSSSTTQQGVRITTGALVSGIPKEPGSVQLDNAITEVGIVRGSRHDPFTDYTCTDINARSVGPNEVEIAYTWDYKFPNPQYEVGSQVILEQTNMDFQGNIITAYYQFPADYKWRSDFQSDDDTSAILVDKYVVETVLMITRQEYITGLQLDAKSKKYTGKMNKETWTLTGDEPGTRFCLGITGTSQDNGVSYTVRYSFAHKPLRMIGNPPIAQPGWNKEVVWIDPHTDQPPEDAESYEWQIYDWEDFNQLQLA